MIDEGRLNPYDAVWLDWIAMSHADLTLVVPAYNERDNVRPFFDELRRALADRRECAEVLFVDDGGSDGT